MSNGDVPSTDDQALRDAFFLFDVNRDGRITATELQSVFSFFGFNNSLRETKQMIKDADCDGNGTVELEEFLRMMRRYCQNQPTKSAEAELRETFNAFDHNHDSVIDFGEIKRTMHFLGVSVTDEEVKEMIRTADRDNDGLVDFEEFKEMMAHFRRRGPTK